MASHGAATGSIRRRDPMSVRCVPKDQKLSECEALFRGEHGERIRHRENNRHHLAVAIASPAGLSENHLIWAGCDSDYEGSRIWVSSFIVRLPKMSSRSDGLSHTFRGAQTPEYLHSLALIT